MSLIQLTQTLFEDQNNSISIFNINGNIPILTPCIFAGIRTIGSLKVIAEYESRFRNLEYIKGLTFPLESVEFIMNRCQALERKYVGNHLRLCIPSTEMMFYNDDQFQKIIRKLNNPDLIHFYVGGKHRNAPQNKKIELFEKWFESERPHYLNLILETIRLEKRYASIYVPPSPPIFDPDLSLDLCIEINKQTEQIVPLTPSISSTPIPLASFLNVGSYCFQSRSIADRFSDKLINYLDYAKSHCIVMKIFNERNISWTREKLENLKIVMDDLINYCKTEEKLLLFVDSVEIGQVLLYNGLSIYGTPLNFQTNSESHKSGFVDVNKFKIWLRHYNELISWERFLNVVDNNNGIIPYSSNLGKFLDINRLRNFNRNDVIKFRYILRAEAINEDCSEFHDAIRNGDTRTAKIQLNNSSLGNISRHLI
jgi:hypothetical protein